MRLPSRNVFWVWVGTLDPATAQVKRSVPRNGRVVQRSESIGAVQLQINAGCHCRGASLASALTEVVYGSVSLDNQLKTLAAQSRRQWHPANGVAYVGALAPPAQQYADAEIANAVTWVAAMAVAQQSQADSLSDNQLTAFTSDLPTLQSYVNTCSANAEAATNADAAAMMVFAGQAAAAIIAAGPDAPSAGAAGAMAAGAAGTSSNPSCTPVFDATINLMAGISDVGTLGIAPTVRWMVGYDPGINRSSGWYWGGAAAPVVVVTVVRPSCQRVLVLLVPELPLSLPQPHRSSLQRLSLSMFSQGRAARQLSDALLGGESVPVMRLHAPEPLRWQSFKRWESLCRLLNTG
jgi:hypothetical protein